MSLGTQINHISPMAFYLVPGPYNNNMPALMINALCERHATERPTLSPSLA